MRLLLDQPHSSLQQSSVFIFIVFTFSPNILNIVSKDEELMRSIQFQYLLTGIMKAHTKTWRLLKDSKQVWR